MSYYDDFRQILVSIPYVHGVDFEQVGFEVSHEWFVKYDIRPRGEKSPTKATYWITEEQLREIMSEHLGPNREEGIGYRWKEVY